MVKCKDTGVYLCYIYTTSCWNHKAYMRCNTWGNSEEKIRTKSGCSTYYMRHWLRLLQRSWLLSSYPLPMSMLSPGGIDRNNLVFKETLRKISWTLWNHCPTWYSIVYSLSSRAHVLCLSSFPCVHAWTHHIQHFI